MNSRFNSLPLGLIMGLFLPALCMLMFYYSSFTRVPVSFFLQYAAQIRILPKIIGVCTVPNLGLFYLFTWRNHLLAARGVLMASFIIAFVILGLILFL